MLFADDISLFWVVHGINASAIDLKKVPWKNQCLGLSIENEFQSRS